MRLESFLARRLVFSRSARSGGALSALGAVGIASLFVIVSLGILAGFQRAYRGAILDFNAHVIVSHPAGVDGEGAHLIETALDRLLSRFPHARSPYLYFETLMPATGGMRPVVVKGVDMERLREVYPFALHRFAGAEGSAFAGEGLVEFAPDIAATRSIKIITVRDDDGRPRTGYDRFAIAGTFASGLQHFDGQYVITGIEELQRRYFHDGKVAGFEIRLDDPFEVPAFAEVLRGELGAVFEITTWDELNASLLDALLLERATFFAVAFLILAIAAMSLFGFNFLFFVSRRREFAILSLLGLSQRRAGRLMALASVSLGAGAVLSACGLSALILALLASGEGITLDPEVYFVKRVPIEFRPLWVGAFSVTALMLCGIAGRLAGRVVLGGRVTEGGAV